MSYVPPHEVLGTGPRRVMLVHGWFADRAAFRGIVDYLDRDAFSYALLDCRGYGEALDVPGAYTISEVSQDVQTLADHLGWDRFSVVGHSMGGKAAQHVLADAPERVTAIVGISPTPASGAGLNSRSQAFFARAADDPAVRWAIIDRTTGGRMPTRWLESMVRTSLARSSASAFAAYQLDWASGDFAAKVNGSSIPALALVGRHDPELSAELMRKTWLRWFTHAELTVIEEAGHYAMDETPLLLVSLIERYLLEQIVIEGVRE